MVLAGVVPGATPVGVDYAANRERQAIYEIFAMKWSVMGIDTSVQLLRKHKFHVDQVQVYWMIQGDQQCAFLVTGTNGETEIDLASKDMPVTHDEGISHVAVGFVRSGGESEDSRALEEHVVCNRRSHLHSHEKNS